MAMKSSDMDKASVLLRDLDRQAKMEQLISSYPAYTGYLSIDRHQIPLSRDVVESLLASELERISTAAAAIDLEFDE